MDGGSDIFKYHHRWYHQQTFDKIFPNLAAVFHSNRSLPHCNPVSNGTAGIKDLQASESWMPLGDDDDSLDDSPIGFKKRIVTILQSVLN
jgi:hypothetical protein